MSVHRETFAALVRAERWTCGAELGVDKGILFGLLLRDCPTLERLIGVDTFPDRARAHRAFTLAAADPRATLLECSTTAAAASVPDRSLDFVFIDADHGAAAVTADIRAWAPKVVRGGWLGGHDYAPKFPGVKLAADLAYGRRVQLWPGTIWGVWC